MEACPFTYKRWEASGLQPLWDELALNKRRLRLSPGLYSFIRNLCKYKGSLTVGKGHWEESYHTLCGRASFPKLIFIPALLPVLGSQDPCRGRAAGVRRRQGGVEMPPPIPQA